MRKMWIKPHFLTWQKYSKGDESKSIFYREANDFFENSKKKDLVRICLKTPAICCTKYL